MQNDATDTPPRLLTTGEIAKRLGQRVDRIARILRTRPHIQPSAMAGNSRLYDHESYILICREIATIDARKTERKRFIDKLCKAATGPDRASRRLYSDSDVELKKRMGQEGGAS